MRDRQGLLVRLPRALGRVVCAGATIRAILWVAGHLRDVIFDRYITDFGIG